MSHDGWFETCNPDQQMYESGEVTATRAATYLNNYSSSCAEIHCAADCSWRSYLMVVCSRVVTFGTGPCDGLTYDYMNESGWNDPDFVTKLVRGQLEVGGVIRFFQTTTS